MDRPNLIDHRWLFAILAWLAVARVSDADDPSAADSPPPTPHFSYPAGKRGAGELRFIDGLPVLTVSGSPKDIGDQIGALALRPGKRMMEYPHDCVKTNRSEQEWPLWVAAGKAMLDRFPPDDRRELRTLADASGADYDTLIAVNTLCDLERIGGCSSLTIDAALSSTGGPLVARNLDFRPEGYLHHYSLITVYRPTGKLAFAAVGFPGMVGILSGMNQAGLTLVTHDVSHSADGSPSFNPAGMPMTLAFRRVMEECKTVAEAEKFVRKVQRTTYLSITICDPHEAEVLELTPNNVIVRHGLEGRLICTNHFRSPELKVSTDCVRFDAITKEAAFPKLGVKDVWRAMNAASQVGCTLQTMVFEPATLKLHLAFGELPSSAAAPKTVELKGLLE